MQTFLIYGSYGYTGQLIVDRALQQGLNPVLAGRDEKKVRAQAESLDLEYRAFSLDNTPALYSALEAVEGVVHCAGPFVHTFQRMAEACLVTRRHYLDISGEIAGFEALAQLDEDAKRAGIMLLPGAGFDVVPSDCLAMHLKKRLLSATHLRLYIRSVRGGFSRGTARSAIENMHRGGMIRQNKELVNVPPAWKVRESISGAGRWRSFRSVGAMFPPPITAPASPISRPTWPSRLCHSAAARPAGPRSAGYHAPGQMGPETGPSPGPQRTDGGAASNRI